MSTITYTENKRPKLARNKYDYTNSVYVGSSGIRNSAAYSNSLSGSAANSGTNYVDFVGATADTDGLGGLVPAPGAGQQNYVLVGDGLWKARNSHVDDSNTLVVDSSLWVTDVTVAHDINPERDKIYSLGTVAKRWYQAHIENASINNILSNNADINYIDTSVLTANEANVRDLTVTGTAHFFKLMIQVSQVH